MSVINMGTPTLNIDMGPFPPGMTGELIPNSAPSADGITYFTEVLILTLIHHLSPRKCPTMAVQPFSLCPSRPFMSGRQRTRQRLPRGSCWSLASRASASPAIEPLARASLSQTKQPVKFCGTRCSSLLDERRQTNRPTSQIYSPATALSSEPFHRQLATKRRWEADENPQTGACVCVVPSSMSEQGKSQFLVAASANLLSFRRAAAVRTSWRHEPRSLPPPPPDVWMHDTSGVLRTLSCKAYLKGKPMTVKDIAAVRTYLRVWIFSPEFDDEGVEALRQAADGLTSREAIEDLGWRMRAKSGSVQYDLGLRQPLKIAERACVSYLRVCASPDQAFWSVRSVKSVVGPFKLLTLYNPTNLFVGKGRVGAYALYMADH